MTMNVNRIYNDKYASQTSQKNYEELLKILTLNLEHLTSSYPL
jgi:hypothetical protein